MDVDKWNKQNYNLRIHTSSIDSQRIFFSILSVPFDPISVHAVRVYA